MKAEQQKKGTDIIDLGVGDPDLPTPDHIVASVCEAANLAKRGATYTSKV
jgi:LL-diaminopimelate aminotransferase